MSVRTALIALSTVLLATALTGLAAPSASAEGPHVPRAGMVHVDTGWLRGRIASDHVTYSAVPYAAPPVGDRRWRPPTRPRPWAGIRDATEPSPLCPQGRRGNVLGQEDCLFLDVTVPSGTRHGDRLPVLVWLHGGGLDSGGAQRFDGARLATEGEMVVVTLNYRLGALGFLSTPALGAARGNYGLMDQAAALRWVRRNVAGFGGDPRNVTLAGQSGGARSVCAQLASPRSRGLFHRAISQSGACDNPVLTRARAEALGKRAVDSLGCSAADDVAACLRESSLDDLVEMFAGVGYGLTDRSGDRPWNPVAGTRVLPVQPAVALRSGTAVPVPLLVGGTRDEMRGFVYGREPILTEDRYRALLVDGFGADADAVRAEYPVADHATPALALSSVLSDWGGQIGACPVLRTAQAASRHQRVFAYEFAEEAGPMPDGFLMGAYHGLDLPYLWTLNGTNPYPPLTPAQQRLSETMIAYWAAFVRTGDVNGAGRPRWPAFGPRQTVVRLSTAGIAPTPFADDHRCAFWADLANPPEGQARVRR